MKRLLFLFAFALLLVACSSEEPIELEVDSEEIAGENETDNTEEDDDSPDEGPNKELERSMTLIPPALDEMAEWNAFYAYFTKYGKFQDSSFDYTHTGYIGYVTDPYPTQVMIEIEQPEMLVEKLSYYGEDFVGSGRSAYIQHDYEGYFEIDTESGVLKDHLKYRHDLLALAHEHGVDRTAEVDANFITENMVIPAEYHEDFAYLLREIIDVEVLYDLDYKMEFKNVVVSITLDGLDLYEYAIQIEYPDDDIDGATDFHYEEYFDMVNDVYLSAPFAG